MSMPGHIVAEHDDDVRAKRIGAFDDRLNVLERHPGIAGVEIGDDGDRELMIGWPLRRRNMIARDPKPQHGLAEAIGRGREAGGAKSGDEAKKTTACEHGVRHLVMLLSVRKLQRISDAFVQIVSR